VKGTVKKSVTSDAARMIAVFADYEIDGVADADPGHIPN
jgi:hypothetical protein